MKGYNGRYIDINLTDGKIVINTLSKDLAKQYLGGYGFIAKTLLDEIPKDAEPLSPENVLCFWTGPLAGTTSPTPSKYAAGAKSPLTNMIGFGISSGYFGPELKRAGFDGIIIRGRANELSYIFIDNDTIKIYDAKHLSGRTTWETEDMIKEELSDSSIRVASIGIAGEKLVRLANITNARNRQIGRSGIGCVMGSKNLKAIAVRGSKQVNVFKEKEFLEFTQELNKRCVGPATEKYRKYGTPVNVLVHNSLGCLPTNNFQKGTFKGAEKISGQTMFKNMVRKMVACEGCAIACDHVCSVLEGNYKGTVASVDYESLWAYGPCCGVDDFGAIVKACELSDRHGIDTISGGIIVAWAMECYEKGILSKKDTDGLDLRFGNADAMVEATRKMCLREGKLGGLLAEGSERAAKKIGKHSNRYLITCKGMEWGGYSMRSLQTSTLGYCTSVRGACYLRSGAYQYDVKGTVDRYALDKERGKLVTGGDAIYAVIDSMIVCKFTRKIYKDNEEMCKLLYLATGIKYTEKEFLETGARIHNTAKLFNIKHGWKRSMDYPPWRATNEYLHDETVIISEKKEHWDRIKLYYQEHDMKPPKLPIKKGAIIKMSEYEEALDSYYRASGWDNVGLPTDNCLKGLQLQSYKKMVDKARKIAKKTDYRKEVEERFR